MRFTKVLANAAALVIVAGVLAAGCGGAASQELTLGYAEWDENVAVSNLTKVLLEEELGYENVELRLVKNNSEALGLLFDDVASGELDAFQDIWMPNHEDYLAGVEDEVEYLDPWYRGGTRFGLAVPEYMDIASIDQINATGADRIYGIEKSTVIMEKIPNQTIPEYGLDQQLVSSGTQAMLAEVGRLYRSEEPFVFVAWSPHWMNQEYDFTYLEDPEGTLGNLTQPAEISTIVRRDLPDKDPVAYAFLDALTLTEDQINGLELEIREADDDPDEGVRRWLADNGAVVEPWISAARQAREG